METNNIYSNISQVNHEVVQPSTVEQGVSTQSDLVGTRESANSGHQIVEMRDKSQATSSTSLPVSEKLKGEADKTCDLVKNSSVLESYANVESTYSNPKELSLSRDNPDSPKQQSAIGATYYSKVGNHAHNNYANVGEDHSSNYANVDNEPSANNYANVGEESKANYANVEEDQSHNYANVDKGHTTNNYANVDEDHSSNYANVGQEHNSNNYANVGEGNRVKYANVDEEPHSNYENVSNEAPAQTRISMGPKFEDNGRGVQINLRDNFRLSPSPITRKNANAAEEGKFCDQVKNLRHEATRELLEKGSVDDPKQQELFTKIVDQNSDNKKLNYADAHRLNQHNPETLTTIAHEAADPKDIEYEISKELGKNLSSANKDLASKINFLSMGPGKHELTNVLHSEMATHMGTALATVHKIDSETAKLFEFVVPGNANATSASYEKMMLDKARPQITQMLDSQYNDQEHNFEGILYSPLKTQLWNVQSMQELEVLMINLEMSKFINDTNRLSQTSP